MSAAEPQPPTAIEGGLWDIACKTFPNDAAARGAKFVDLMVLYGYGDRLGPPKTERGGEDRT